MSTERIAFFDIESYDTRGTAAVLSFGFVVIDPSVFLTFDQLVKQSHEIKIALSPQKGRRTIDPETVQWWSEQGAAARRVTQPSDADIHPEDFSTHVALAFEPGESHHIKWYCRGPHFDAAIIESFCDEFNQEIPWHFASIRDMRTWCDFYNIRMQHPNNMVPHNAAHDACLEALQYLHIEHGRAW